MSQESMDVEENNGSKPSEVKTSKKKFKNPFGLDKKEEKLKRQQKKSRIVIRNISYKATDESLKEYLGQFGEIEEVNLLKRPDGKLVGCAFVQYSAVNQAAKAILKGNGKEFLGRPIYIDWAVGKDVYLKKKEATVKTENDEIKEEKSDPEVKEEKQETDEIDEHSVQDEDSGSEYSDNEDIKEEDDSENDNEDIEEQIPNKKEKKKKSNDVEEGCTVFIKNVPFDATQKELWNACKGFGPMHYAIINTDPISGHPKGTAFVKFKRQASADLCLSAGAQFMLNGVLLEPFPALTRDDVKKKTSKTPNEPADNRHLYLAKEGLIMAGSKAADGVSASDMAKRHKLEQVKTQILKNLNRFVSKNRLSIHNLPVNYDNEKLRDMVIKQTGFKPHECRVMRENKPTIEYPQGKSKGFGFMSFKTHNEALIALRKLNNNPSIFGSQNRPIVGFSIEDRSVHNIKENRLKKSRENNPTYKLKLEKKRAKRAAKKQNQPDKKDDVQKDVKKVKFSKKNKTVSGNDKEMDDYVGVSAKPGTFVRMRSMKKIKQQSQEHTKKVSHLKKIEKRKKEKLLIRKEKKQIDRPKQGKKKIKENDNFSHLVNKYKRLIDSKADAQNKKSKRTKWYVEESK